MRGSQNSSLLGWLAATIAVAALTLSIVGLRADDGSAAAGAASAAAVIEVTMSEFAFEPANVQIPAGGATLRFRNVGSAAHNVVVPDLNIDSGDIAPGDSADVRVRGDQEGTFPMVCIIAGHKENGMVGTLMIGSGQGGSPGGAGGGAMPGHKMTNEEMDRMMNEVAAQFPAETEGVGGQPLEPRVAADGAKEFVISAEVVEWEVAPGKFVEAWTYNGTVPAPTIRVDSGDLVRMIVTNNTPESTAVHLHGIKVPNSMDGVDPYTQPAILPGETFTYEFVAQGPAVGIYHSHHNAQEQVPNGMFGALLIDQLPIPQALIDKGITDIDYETTMVLNDAGNIGLSLNGKSFPATAPYTMKTGETMLVHYLNEGLMAHPMHLHQPAGWVIAKDGIPLDVPMPSDTVNVAPGERYSVLYTPEEPGVWAWHCHILNHAESSEGMFGMVTALIVEEAS
jgi:manganese oxidase